MLVFQSDSATWRSLTRKTLCSSSVPGAKAQLSRTYAYLKRIETIIKTYFQSLAPLPCSMQCSTAKPRQSVSPKTKATAACWPPSAAKLTRVWYTGNKCCKTTCHLQAQMGLIEMNHDRNLCCCSTWHNRGWNTPRSARNSSNQTRIASLWLFPNGEMLQLNVWQHTQGLPRGWLPASTDCAVCPTIMGPSL